MFANLVKGRFFKSCALILLAVFLCVDLGYAQSQRHLKSGQLATAQTQGTITGAVTREVGAVLNQPLNDLLDNHPFDTLSFRDSKEIPEMETPIKRVSPYNQLVPTLSLITFLALGAVGISPAALAQNNLLAQASLIYLNADATEEKQIKDFAQKLSKESLPKHSGGKADNKTLKKLGVLFPEFKMVTLGDNRYRLDRTSKTKVKINQAFIHLLNQIPSIRASLDEKGRIVVSYIATQAFYEKLLRGLSEASGLSPLEMEEIVKKESKYDEDALSPRGANGYTQLMPVAVIDVMNEKKSVPDYREALPKLFDKMKALEEDLDPEIVRPIRKAFDVKNWIELRELVKLHGEDYQNLIELYAEYRLTEAKIRLSIMIPDFILDPYFQQNIRPAWKHRVATKVVWKVKKKWEGIEFTPRIMFLSFTDGGVNIPFGVYQQALTRARVEFGIARGDIDAKADVGLTASMGYNTGLTRVQKAIQDQGWVPERLYGSNGVGNEPTAYGGHFAAWKIQEGLGFQAHPKIVDHAKFVLLPTLQPLKDEVGSRLDQVKSDIKKANGKKLDSLRSEEKILEITFEQVENLLQMTTAISRDQIIERRLDEAFDNALQKIPQISNSFYKEVLGIQEIYRQMVEQLVFQEQTQQIPVMDIDYKAEGILTGEPAEVIPPKASTVSEVTSEKESFRDKIKQELQGLIRWIRDHIGHLISVFLGFLGGFYWKNLAADWDSETPTLDNTENYEIARNIENENFVFYVEKQSGSNNKFIMFTSKKLGWFVPTLAAYVIIKLGSWFLGAFFGFQNIRTKFIPDGSAATISIEIRGEVLISTVIAAVLAFIFPVEVLLFLSFFLAGKMIAFFHSLAPTLTRYGLSVLSGGVVLVKPSIAQGAEIAGSTIQIFFVGVVTFVLALGMFLIVTLSERKHLRERTLKNRAERAGEDPNLVSLSWRVYLMNYYIEPAMRKVSAIARYRKPMGPGLFTAPPVKPHTEAILFRAA